MTQKGSLGRKARDRGPALPKGQGKTARPDHNNPVTIEAFDRERMGIAAKE